MLGLAEGWHAAILENPAGSGVIGREGVDDVAIECVELGREIARAAMHLKVGAVIVFRVDAQIAGRPRHDLGETIGADGRPCPNRKPALLPDQRLQQRAPLDGGETRAANSRKAAGFLGDADDELLDGLRRVPEHLRPAGIGVDLARAIDCFHRAVGIAAAAFQPRDHSRQSLTAEAGLGIEDASEGFKLFALDLGDEFAHCKLVGLNSQVCFAVAGLDDVTRGQPAVIGRHALRQGETGQQAKCEDMRQARLQCRPPAHLEA